MLSHSDLAWVGSASRWEELRIQVGEGKTNNYHQEIQPVFAEQYWMLVHVTYLMKGSEIAE